jgi:hypothetical protein
VIRGTPIITAAALMIQRGMEISRVIGLPFLNISVRIQIFNLLDVLFLDIFGAIRGGWFTHTQIDRLSIIVSPVTH